MVCYSYKACAHFLSRKKPWAISLAQGSALSYTFDTIIITHMLTAMLISPNVEPINTLSLKILRYYCSVYQLMVVMYRYLTLPVVIPSPMISLQHYLIIPLQNGLSMPILKESVYPTGLENITLRISKATVFRKILLPNIWIQPHGSVP